MCIRDSLPLLNTSILFCDVPSEIHAEEAIEGEIFRVKVVKMEGVQGRSCLLYTSKSE